MKKLLFTLLSIICFSASYAQDSYDERPFKHLGVGLKASTLGPGIELSTTLSKNFKLRAGLNIAKYSHSYDIEMEDDMLNMALGYDPDYDMKAKLDFAHGHLLFDIHPMRYGVFHFTAGVFFGNSKIKASGLLVNPETGQKATLRPEFVEQYGGWEAITLELDKHGISIDDARIDAELELGNTIKPYFGIGIGRSLPKKRLGFMFEIGALYQGDYKLKQNGRKVENFEDLSRDSFGEDISDFTDWLKWWPMINFQLTYRIF